MRPPLLPSHKTNRKDVTVVKSMGSSMRKEHEPLFLQVESYTDTRSDHSLKIFVKEDCRAGLVNELPLECPHLLPQLFCLRSSFTAIRSLALSHHSPMMQSYGFLVPCLSIIEVFIGTFSTRFLLARTALYNFLKSFIRRQNSVQISLLRLTQ